MKCKDFSVTHYYAKTRTARKVILPVDKLDAQDISPGISSFKAYHTTWPKN